MYEILAAVEIVEVTRPVLNRAAQPFGATLGTLDSIHLVTALLWTESRETALTFATHDEAPGRAARSCGLGVVGIRT
ncbi:MAG: hypothetical protein JXO72_12565 [Vicinamibacteria bacterium]|nr:hypothetical protein [Vicinamibacteria bacterium]